MKQILQSLNDGTTDIIEVPAPQPVAGQLLIQSSVSLISAGTERMLLSFGKAGLIGKVKQQPDKVKQVLGKIKTDGLLTTIEAVKSKLEQPIPLGYCNVGRVINVGDNVSGFSVGDRILSNGAHAEVVRVPKNLCVKIPDVVSDEAAVFAILGAIGLQGVRLAKPTLGEMVVVLGLGLIGLLTVQLLRAHGCRVLGADFDRAKLSLAKQFGAETVDLSQEEDLVSSAIAFSRGRGVDAVLITAATKSSDPVHQASLMCRKRGRIVLVGVTGLELSRDDFYKKELIFQVSCSYGPGRYDHEYEDKGNDYPIGFVRWTEQRNMEAVLDMMAEGKINTTALISNRFAFEQAEEAYNKLDSNRGILGIILQYPLAISFDRQIPLKTREIDTIIEGGKAIVAFVGAGNYASRMLIPAFKQVGALLHTVVSDQGVSAAIQGKKGGFKEAATDYNAVLHNPAINAVVIATRHNQHAEQIAQALRVGKHVFVEKPLVITMEQLQQVRKIYSETLQIFPGQKLMVGFNRRFAPHIKQMKALLAATSSPKFLVMTINAGFIPEDHWTQDPEIGGGRLIGEGCHFVDLLRFLVGAPIVDSKVICMAKGSNFSKKAENFTIVLQFADGSLGTVHYFANGNKMVAKEKLEVSVAGKALLLDNFRQLRGYGWKDLKKMFLWKQDKGQREAVRAWTAAIELGEVSPIPCDEIFEVMEVCLNLSNQLR